MSHCFLIVFFIQGIEIYEGISGVSFHFAPESVKRNEEKMSDMKIFPRRICIKNDKKDSTLESCVIELELVSTKSGEKF